MFTPVKKPPTYDEVKKDVLSGVIVKCPVATNEDVAHFMMVRKDWSEYIRKTCNETISIYHQSFLSVTDSNDLRLPLNPKVKSRIILKELISLISIMKDIASKHTCIDQILFCQKILSATLTCLRKFANEHCSKLVKQYTCASNRLFIHKIVYFVQHECYLFLTDIDFYANRILEYLDQENETQRLVNLSLLLIRVYQVWMKYTTKNVSPSQSTQ